MHPISCSFANAFTQDDFVTTHIGKFPKRCIHQAKSPNIQLHFTANSTIEYYKDTNTKIFHPIFPDCLEFVQQNIYNKKKHRNNKSKPHSRSQSQSQLEGFGDWLAFVETTLSNDVSYIGAEYSLPGDVPSDTSIAQFLIWGLGLQGTESSNTENTFEMQPLITYCGEPLLSHSVCNGTIKPGYGFTTSECCTNGQLWYGLSHGVAPATSGIFGYMETSATTAHIQCEFGNFVSGLNIHAVDEWMYDFAFAEGGNGGGDDYSNCDDYPGDEFLITQLYAKDYNGNFINNDEWSEGGFGECGAYVEEYEASLENGQFGLYLKQ